MAGPSKVNFQATWIFFAVMYLHTQGVFPLECYVCQWSNAPGYDYGCVNPDNSSLATTIGCSECLTSVQTTTATGDLYSVRRGCYADEPIGCDGHPSTETCNSVCNDTDLCNDENCEPVPKSSTPPQSSLSTASPGPITVPPETYLCYSCVFSYSIGADPICVNNPAGVPFGTVRCRTDYVCTTFRQWDNAEKVIRSFSRSCQIKTPTAVNNCVEDYYFTTYNTYCQTELCNGGDGMLPCPPPPDQGGGGGGGGSAGRGSSTIHAGDTVAGRRVFMAVIIATIARIVIG